MAVMAYDDFVAEANLISMSPNYQPRVLIVNAANEETSEAVKKDLKPVTDDVESVIKSDRDSTESLTKKYEDKIISLEEFKALATEQRNRCIEAYRAKQDEILQKVIEAGEAHPESRSGILSMYQSISKVISEVVQKIADFLLNLVDNVVRWVKKAVEEVVNFFSGVISTVKSGLAFLF